MVWLHGVLEHERIFLPVYLDIENMKLSHSQLDTIMAQLGNEKHALLYVFGDIETTVSSDFCLGCCFQKSQKTKISSLGS